MTGNLARWLRWTLIATAALLLFATQEPASPVLATAFTVDSTADAVDANPGDGLCDDGAGACTLRAAVQETNALPGADAISLPAGSYTLAIPGTGEDASATGDLDITDDLTLTGAGADATIIDGAGQHRAFHIVNAATVHIGDLGIVNGYAGDADGHGGGVYNQSGDTTLTDATISDSEAPAGGLSEGGGGFANAASAQLNRVRIHDNEGFFGGGVQNELSGTLDVLDSAIYRNHSTDRGGGFANHGGVMTINSSSIYDNTASDGRPSGFNDGPLEIVNTTITGNSSDFGEGDGFDTDVAVISSTIAGNNAPVMHVIGSSVVNSIVAESDCPEVNSLGHNIYVAFSSSCVPSHPTDVVVDDPLLHRVEGADGRLTLQPFAGSPAIDAGDDSACPPVDQLALPRPRDGNGDGVAVCDIGAVEVQEPVLAPTPGIPPATPVWGQPFPLNTNAQSDTAQDSAPQMDTDGKGNWIAVCVSDANVLASRSSDNEDIWSDPVLVSPSGSIAASVVTDGSGVWIAAWDSTLGAAGNLGDDTDIFFARSTDNGAHWSKPELLNADASTDTGLEGLELTVGLSAVDGTWVAVWSRFQKGSFIARSADGETWSDPISLGIGGVLAGPAATDGQGNWMVVWDDTGLNAGDDSEVVFSVSSDDGASWSEPGFVDSSTYFTRDDDRYPVVAAGSDGNWIVTWVKHRVFVPLATVVVVAHSSDLGQSWTPPQPLTPMDAPTPTDPRIATDDLDTWIAAWQSDQELSFALSEDGGVTWTDPAPIRPPGIAAAGQDFGVSLQPDGSGRWLAAWSSTDSLGGTIGDDNDVLYALLPATTPLPAPSELPDTGSPPAADSGVPWL
ncbi:MAG: sialidase family protein, partial [Dehalococcoidia bacterium]